MTRAERVMELHAQLYQMDEIEKRVVRPAAEALGLYVTRDSYNSKRKELMTEYKELKRHLGFSERRQFAELIAAWKGEVHGS